MASGVNKIQDLPSGDRYGAPVVFNKYPTSSGPSAGPSPSLERKTPVGKDPLADDNAPDTSMSAQLEYSAAQQPK